MNAKQRKTDTRISVADYVTHQIVLSGKSQKDIAEELGYEKPNIITMFKQGKTKVPINKVPEFAKALGVDPIHFLRITLLEYAPSIWEVVEKLLGKTMVSENELEIIQIIRESADGADIAPRNKSEADDLRQVIKKWKKDADDKESKTRRVNIN